MHAWLIAYLVFSQYFSIWYFSILVYLRSRIVALLADYRFDLQPVFFRLISIFTAIVRLFIIRQYF